MKREKIICATQLGATIAVVGPTGSGKSTLLDYLTGVDDSKLLANNIGESNQTTKMPFRLSLNEEMEKGRVIIVAKRVEVGKEHFRNIIKELAKATYNRIDNDDDLEDVIDENVLEAIFNPRNEEFKAYKYLKTKSNCDIDKLIESMCSLVKILPKDLEEECKRKYKELKKKNKNSKKEQSYIETITDELYDCLDRESCLKENIKSWIKDFKQSIEDYYDRFFDYEYTDGKVIYTDVVNESLSLFIRAVFDKESVFSLVFSELTYITRPSDEFLNYYKENYSESYDLDKPLIINILDTMGISHISDEKSSLEDAIDEILTKIIDGFLFICKSDEKRTVYNDFLEILKKKSNKKDGRLFNKPATVLRTKADIIVKMKAVKNHKLVTGKNEIEKAKIKDYYTEALKEYKQEYIEEAVEKCNISSIGDGNTNIEYIAIVPNEVEELKKVLENDAKEEKIFKSILDLNERIQSHYSKKGLIVAVSKNGKDIGVNELIILKEDNIEKLGEILVEKNEVHSKGQYLNLNGYYHGRSIRNYYTKHKIGVGHESNSTTCDNFRIYIVAMIAGWLRNTNLFEKSFLHELDLSKIDFNDENDINKIVKEYFKENRQQLLFDMASKLSYDFMKLKFEECYELSSWRTGFKKNLELFNSEFSDKKYWIESIGKWTNEIVEKVLSRILYIKK